MVKTKFFLVALSLAANIFVTLGVNPALAASACGIDRNVNAGLRIL